MQVQYGNFRHFMVLTGKRWAPVPMESISEKCLDKVTNANFFISGQSNLFPDIQQYNDSLKIRFGNLFGGDTRCLIRMRMIIVMAMIF